MSGGLGATHVILPAYNEAEALPSVLERLAAQARERPEAISVWVVDDGSSDGTADAARRGASGLDVQLISHPKNLGLGPALNTGIRAVLAACATQDVVVVMDADDTHDIGLIPLMRERLAGGADVAIASRFVEGGQDETAPPFRRLLSRGASVTFRTLLPLSGQRDFTSGYRAYRASLLKRAADHWGERLIVERGFACMVELLLNLRHCHPVIVEVPMVLRYDRKTGESKLKLGRTLVQYLKLAIRDRLSPPPVREL